VACRAWRRRSWHAFGDRCSWRNRFFGEFFICFGSNRQYGRRTLHSPLRNTLPGCINLRLAAVTMRNRRGRRAVIRATVNYCRRRYARQGARCASVQRRSDFSTALRSHLHARRRERFSRFFLLVP
jgi:hypothetical protein